MSSNCVEVTPENIAAAEKFKEEANEYFKSNYTIFIYQTIYIYMYITL